jgi:hypothetical protein
LAEKPGPGTKGFAVQGKSQKTGIKSLTCSGLRQEPVAGFAKILMGKKGCSGGEG